MKKWYLYISIFIQLGGISFAQEKWIEKDGFVSFFSSAPLEDIKAESNSVVSILDLEKNNAQVLMKISSFDFPKKLMQEHFNENYMESHKFPTSKLTAELPEDFINELSETKKEFDIQAKLLIHGVEKDYNIKAFFSKTEDQIRAESKFKVRVADHQIKIPKIVFKKIAEVVEVTAQLTWEKKK